MAHGRETAKLLRAIAAVGKSGLLQIQHLDITSIPPLPLKVRELRIYGCADVTTLELPAGLEVLDLVHTTGITQLPELPESLKTLLLINVPVTSLPELPKGLKHLSYTDTQLETLPYLPEHLERLGVTGIKVLPKLPESLTDLHCTRSYITELPKLPKNLIRLSCYGSAIKKLPQLPKKLELLDVAMTPLTELPELPDTLFTLRTSYTAIVPAMKSLETVQEYKVRWNAWKEENDAPVRAHKRNEHIKEELMAAFWNPRRIEKILEQGGWELMDSLS